MIAACASQPPHVRGVIPCTLRFNTYLIGALVLALAAVSVLAWRQQFELVQLRAAALGGGERAALRAQVESLQSDKQVDDSMADAVSQEKEEAKATAATALAKLAALAASDADSQSKKDETFELLGALSDTPEFQKLLALEQRGKVDAKFAALFRRLKLSPEAQSQLETLLADKQSAYADAMIAAHEQGLTGKAARDLANTVANSTQKQIDGSIKSLLGPQGFNQYQNYERTLPQREAVNQLAQQLSYTASPLTVAQQDKLVQVLATTAAAPKVVAGSNAPPTKAVAPIAPLSGTLANLGIGSAPSAPITNAAVAQSQTFLSPQQTAALSQMRQQQQAQQTLNRVLSGKPATPAPKPGK